MKDWSKKLATFTMFVAATVLGPATVGAQICTDIDPIPFISDTNCASAAACQGAAVGAACGGGNVCTPFATRFRSACCTCNPPGGAAAAALKCLAKRTNAEAKFVQCHAKTTAKASLRALQPDYARCLEKLDQKYQKSESRFGPDCPQGTSAQQTANTYAALLGDPGIDAQSVLLCGPNSQWDIPAQLCVPNCPP